MAMDFPKGFPSPVRDLSVVSGQWHGYYEQEARRFPIKAILHQSDSKITGTMKDIDREQRFHLVEYAKQFSMSPDEESRYLSGIAAQFGNPPPEEISLVQILAERSQLIGAIVENEIYFHKTYESPTILRVQYGRRRGESPHAPHPVHYEGILFTDRSTIAGEWTIEGSTGNVLSKGCFELSRD